MSFGFGLGAFGSGFAPALGEGLDLYDKYTTLQGQAGAVKLLQEMGIDQQALPLGTGPGALAQPGGMPPTGRLPGASLSPSLGQSPEAAGPMGGPEGPTSLAGGGPQGVPPSVMFGGMPGVGGAPPMAGGVPPMRTGLPGQPAVPTTSFRPGGPAGGVPTTPQVQPEQVRQQVPDQPQRPMSDSDRDAIVKLAQTGQGSWSQQDLAQRIDKAMPGASAMAKFKAMQAASKLMNPSGQDQFSRTMRYLEYKRQLERDDEQRRHNRALEAAKDPQVAIDKAARIAAAKAPIQSLTATLRDTDRTYSNTKAQHDTLAANTNTLIDLAKKVSITGNITLDNWFRAIQDKLGLTAPEVAAYRAQANAVLMEAASIANVRAGVITEGQRKEAERALQPGAIMPPKLLEELAAVWKKDATNKEQAYLKRRKQILKQIEALGKGEEPPMEEEPAPAATGGGTAPAGGTDPMGLFK